MKKTRIDLPLAITIGFLVFFGIVMISSVSVYESFNITKIMLSNGELDAPNNSFYLLRQLKHAVLAIPVLFLGMYLPLQFWKKLALPFFLFCWLLLILVLLLSSGDAEFSARSWINLPYLPSIQPSEFMKLALIFYLAVWMEKRQELVRSFQYGFLPFTVLLSMVVILVAVQPDFGTLMITAIIAGMMFFAAGGNILHILGGASFAFLMAYFVTMTEKYDYIRDRFLIFLNPELDPQKLGFQIKQALIAVGNGGWFGVGFGKSVQKFGYLPEVQGDSIFAAIAEEMGFVRILFLVLAYAFIAYRGYLISLRVQENKDRFPMLVSVGITTWFVFQALINMAVNLSLFPLTGVTLPFVSYGGSSLLVNMLAAGILLNISRYGQNAAHYAGRRRVGRSYRPQLRRRFGA